jgi:hypothetical protein
MAAKHCASSTSYRPFFHGLGRLPFFSTSSHEATSICSACGLLPFLDQPFKDPSQVT